ncbi:signal peptidase I [Dactylosporangium aurantiacum]|uniref:Signal peptidase I n=1 Tax=Dactylosporangium aurantiacum TaxID=35754 RepID=A0A9Q9ISK6_9ACTN|nr:signal peptidase I [Dactylosporangium aurantiacum]MDG6106274.1 signal peptidase I [Dactylosporangium aurantiacum]UWZ58228.1 signal peptidase I [Dactylosporangium aurantiacum]
MRSLGWVLAVVVVAGAAGCGAAAEEETERFTQGGVSMEPAVKAGQVITVRKVGRGYSPRRGDVVLFRDAGPRWVATSSPLLKRVVAVGGETVACCDAAGKVTVNGAPLDEPYVTQDAPLDVPPNPQSCESRRFGPVAVPADAVFVLGDNRARSNDSRCAGPVPTASVFAVMTGG